MIADITKLITIVNFPTSLVIRMTCAGGSDPNWKNERTNVIIRYFSLIICVVMQK